MSGWIFFAESATQTVSGFRNVTEQNGVSISLTGMLIVFIALSLISLVLAVLPHVVDKLNNFFPPARMHNAPAKAEAGAQAEEDTIMAAIGFVLHTQMTRTRN